jgi:hypothetical protein
VVGCANRYVQAKGHRGRGNDGAQETQGKGAVETGETEERRKQGRDDQRLRTNDEESNLGGSSWRRRLPQDLVELMISPFRIGNVVAQAAKGAEKESASKDSSR